MKTGISNKGNVTGYNAQEEIDKKKSFVNEYIKISGIILEDQKKQIDKISDSLMSGIETIDDDVVEKYIDSIMGIINTNNNQMVLSEMELQSMKSANVHKD